MLQLIFALCLSYMAFNTAIKAVSLYAVNRHIQRRQTASAPIGKAALILPVYYEESVIHECCEYYSRIQQRLPELNIVFVGTEREKEGKTLALIEAYIKKHRPSGFVVLKAPVNRRFMAGQLNYAVESVGPTYRKLCFFNVDSRPTAESIQANIFLLDTSPVVQQYGDYFGNAPTKVGSFTQAIYLATFLWQSAWSKQFEIRNTLWNNWIKSSLLKKFSYVVGHGLFIRPETLKEVGYFSETHQNEDMELSIRLFNAGIPIEYGVGFSKSDMPLNLSDYLKQQAVWARGPMLAFQYSKGMGIKAKLTCAKLFLHYLYWVSEPFIIGGLLLSSLALSPVALGAALLTLITYIHVVFIAPNWSFLSQHETQNNRLFIFIGSLAFLFLHGIGPLKSAFIFATEKFTGREKAKFKTPKL